MTESREALLKNGNDEFIIAEIKFLKNNLNERVNIFLTNGVKLEGTTLLEYDDVCILVTQRGSTKEQLIYKSSVATIQSTRGY